VKLQVPFIQLPLAFDAGRLEAEIAALGEDAWRPHPQGFAGNSMLPLVAAHGSLTDESFAEPMQATPHLLACPYLQQVMASFGAVLGRSRLMRLSGMAEVTRHADHGYYWVERVRIHVPIVTQPTVRFDCGDASVHMGAGECWVFDTWRQHNVINDAVAARIHLVADSVGGPGLWELMSRGRRVEAMQASAPVAPVPVPFREGETPRLVFESSNVPIVMSPWELNAHLGFLLGEALPHPQAAVVQQHVARLARRWRALWAEHGDAPSGHAQFRALFQQFVADVRAPSQGMALRNELGWYDAMRQMIEAFCVRSDSTAPYDARAVGDNA